MNIIIIGATSGIGRRLSEIYIQKGYRVGITGRRGELLNEIKGNNENVFTREYDVTSKDADKELLTLIEEMKGVDICIYSSGFGKSNPKLDLTIGTTEVEVNVKGFVTHASTLFNYWSNNNKKGHLTVISSIAGVRELGIAPGYSATKHFQSFYMEALRQLASMRGADISFTTIKPGFVNTDFISGKKYPYTLPKEAVAQKIVKATERKKKNCVIYGIWRPIAILMKIVPSPLWRKGVGNILKRYS